MRFIFLVVLASILGAQANAATPTRPKELMKCTSAKLGTLWASFGTELTSDNPAPIYFPTEFDYFGPDFTTRLLFPDWREALKLGVQFDGHHFSATIVFTSGTRVQTHQLSLNQFDPRIDNAFLGNWHVSETGQADIDGEISCSID